VRLNKDHIDITTQILISLSNPSELQLQNSNFFEPAFSVAAQKSLSEKRIHSTMIHKRFSTTKLNYVTYMRILHYLYLLLELIVLEPLR